MYSFISQIIETIAPTQQEQINDSNSIINDSKEDNNNNNIIIEQTEEDDDILSISFNQDNSCISVATLNGFRIYQSKPFIKAFECNNNNISCRKVSMLFATSLVALIGGGINIKNMNNINNISSLRNVKLYNTKNKQELCRLNFKSTVLNVKMNKSRLVICVENKLHIFDLINNMKQIYEISTYLNPFGIFDLCCDDDNNLLSYPDKSKQGSIGILDAYNLQKRTIIEAHDNSLQNISFNPDGNYLCSTSIMGTLIRIFAIPSGTHIYTFRRGTYPSTIYSISFNPSSTLLAITSQRNIKNITNIISQTYYHYNNNNNNNNNNDDEYIYPSMHIFDLNKYKYNQSKKISSSQSINQLNNKINEYLPQSFKNQIEHPRSIITINIKNKDNKTNRTHKKSIPVICGWLNDYSLVCATKSGYFYRYSINDNDNSYKLLSEHTLKDNDYDLHKQQKTKIYKTTSTKEKEKEQEIEKEIEKESPKKKENNNNNNNNNSNIDDLFDLSDAEYDANNGNTPGH